MRAGHQDSARRSSCATACTRTATAARRAPRGPRGRLLRPVQAGPRDRPAPASRPARLRDPAHGHARDEAADARARAPRRARRPHAAGRGARPRRPAPDDHRCRLPRQRCARTTGACSTTWRATCSAAARRWTTPVSAPRSGHERPPCIARLIGAIDAAPKTPGVAPQGPRRHAPPLVGHRRRTGGCPVMRLALIGTGMMGERLGGRLLDAGHELAVYNRTAERTAALAARGRAVATTPREAAAGGRPSCSRCSPTRRPCAPVAYGDDGLLAGAEGGAPVGRPLHRRARRLARVRRGGARARACAMLDAPVSGSLGAAEKGMLVFLVGGAAERRRGGAAASSDVLGRATRATWARAAPAAPASSPSTPFCSRRMAAAVEAVRLGAQRGCRAGGAAHRHWRAPRSCRPGRSASWRGSRRETCGPPSRWRSPTRTCG